MSTQPQQTQAAPAKTVIREATFDDIESVVELGRDFIAGSQYAGFVKPDGEAMFHTVRSLVEHHVVFVLEVMNGPVVGILGMMVYPHAVTGEQCAVECFWWVDPTFRGHGLSMLKRAEQWATDKGAAFIQMVQPDSEARLGKVYERLGYRVTEHQYQKRLTL